MPALLQTMREGVGTQHPEEIINFLMSRFVVTSGIFDVVGGDFLVAESDTPAMSIQIAQGYAFLVNSTAGMTYPVRLTDANATVTIDSNAAGNPRIDSIVLYIDLGATANPAISNVAKVVAVKGTAAASPVAPDGTAITAIIGASNPYIVIADVQVDSGETTILDADITDQRVEASYISRPESRPIYDNGDGGAAATIDWSNGDTQKITLTANCTLTFTNVKEGQYLTLYVIQDGTGSRTLTYPVGTKNPAATEPTLSSGAANRDILAFRAFSSTIYDLVAYNADLS